MLARSGKTDGRVKRPESKGVAEERLGRKGGGRAWLAMERRILTYPLWTRRTAVYALVVAIHFLELE